MELQRHYTVDDIVMQFVVWRCMADKDIHSGLHLVTQFAVWRCMADKDIHLGDMHD